MAKDSKKTCQHCKFWTGDFKSDYGTGECRRGTPTFSINSGLSGTIEKESQYSNDPTVRHNIRLSSDDCYSSEKQGYWPTTKATDWCGGFEERKEEPKNGIERALDWLEEKENENP